MGLVVLEIEASKNLLEAIYPMAAFALYMVVTGVEGILSNQIIYVKRQEKNQVIMIFASGIINLIMNNLLVEFYSNYSYNYNNDFVYFSSYM